MAIIHVDETYPGLPNSGRLSGTNGDLVGIMDIALPLNGWSIEYTSGNARVYRPGTGNRFRLHMNDDSSVSGNAGLTTVRGCENASGATTLIDPFPTVAAVTNANANWVKSSAVSTAARQFDIWVGETFVIYAVNYGGTANAWDCHFFGDCPAALTGDSYNTVCFVRKFGSSSSVFFGATGTGGFNASAGWLYWARTYDGSVKSPSGWYSSVGYNSIGLLAGGYYPFAGPSGGLDTRKISLADAGAANATTIAATGVLVRGWLPNILEPLHKGTPATNNPSTRDTYTDTAYAPGFIGSVIRNSNSANNAFLVVETTDTWSPPSG